MELGRQLPPAAPPPGTPGLTHVRSGLEPGLGVPALEPSVEPAPDSPQRAARLLASASTLPCRQLAIPGWRASWQGV